MEQKFGVLGTAVTFGTAGFGWLVQHEAELRALSFAVSIVVGALTASWWLRKWWRAIKNKNSEE